MNKSSSENGLQTLHSLGLSESGVLHSTGIRRHRERLEAGTTDAIRLARYADSLCALQAASEQAGGKIPIDFWDVRTDIMAQAGLDEYEMACKLSRPEFLPYVEFLGRCYSRFIAFKTGTQTTAVATALAMLCESALYVQSGNTLEMTTSVPKLDREQQAILLWQQVLTGTARTIPFIHRDAYSHFIWGHFNVIEMWSYQQQAQADPSETWGLSGFHDDFIGDPKNINQIEHMAISAVAQKVLRIPLILLDLLEDVEWLLRWASYRESKADKRLNHAVAHDLLRPFDLNHPQHTCETLERALARA